MRIEDNPAYERTAVRELTEDAVLNTSDTSKLLLPKVTAGEITPVQESVQDWALRRKDEQRRKQLRNYGI